MPSNRIHCVIPNFLHLKKPFALQTIQTLILSPSVSTPTIKPRSSYSSSAYDIKQKLLHNHQNNPRFPAGPTSPPALQLTSPRSSLFSTASIIMSDGYISFLDKANADPNAGYAQQGTDSIRTETIHTSVQVPASLASVDKYYTSDTDEPFEPVALKWDGASRGDWPSADQFSNLISPNKDLSEDITTLSASSFDPKNQYSTVFRAVRAAAVEHDDTVDQSSIDVKVYRVELSSTKLEYWVLALSVAEGQVVGLRAKAVES
ncbi:hypothetical protein N7495_000387 [Penicillium taxi]|uniref:uncharacterized protein n=1 Tax=Penicillium taxi TaxID=168475 RepID=UPI00254539C2|nr:uncharacterized protein N7495_000387 [Penicillium taxi]KAJ5907705.1 hypothetical protein N7495_000387 [Penicillium taxi]